jgi:RNA polymerase sigma factor (sigma-70 family)
VTACGHPGSATSDMPVVREGQPPDQSRRILVGAAGERNRRCPAPGVLLPGWPTVASDVAAAATAQADFPPATEGTTRAVGGELSVLSETVADVDFNAFYAAESRSLVRSLCSWAAPTPALPRIPQTAFTRAFPAWNTIRFPQAWLRKVAQNEYWRHCRATARETSLDADPDRADYSAGISAAMALEQQAATREVLAAIADLPPKQRQVMAWHWDGFSDAEIAAELGDSAAAVRKNRNRAMKSLRQSLAHVGRQRK